MAQTNTAPFLGTPRDHLGTDGAAFSPILGTLGTLGTYIDIHSVCTHVRVGVRAHIKVQPLVPRYLGT